MKKESLLQQVVSSEIIEKKIKQIESENPGFISNPENLVLMNVGGDYADLMLAYFSEVNNNKNRKKINIEKFIDRITYVLTGSIKVDLVEFSTNLNQCLVPSMVGSLSLIPTTSSLAVGNAEEFLELQQMRIKSHEKASSLRKKLGLPEDTSEMNGFTKLEGLLKEYSIPGEDAVEILRQIRN